RRNQTLVGKQRWVDPSRQVTQGFECLVGIRLQLHYSQSRFLWGRGGEHLRQSQLDLQRHEMLLGAIVQIAFETATFFVRGAHQPLPRAAQLVDAVPKLRSEPNVSQ